MGNYNNEKPGGPWYRQYRYWSKIALDYIRAYKKIPKEAEHHAEFKAFQQYMGYRLVFESNLIEGEGLSPGDTKKVVKECFPSIPENYEVIRRLGRIEEAYIDDYLRTNKIGEIIETIEKLGLPKGKIIPSISFANKSRGYIEVFQHYSAYLTAQKYAFELEIKRYLDLLSEVLELFNSMKERNNKIEELSKEIVKAMDRNKGIDNLLKEDKIKTMHKIMAKGLLPEDAKVEAGNYRIDDRTVGDFGIAFPAPELVPKCMEKFIINANPLILLAWEKKRNIFEVAALISHEFVRIHPFTDFNGRISRLLLMIVLMANGVPFAVTLRGDKKGRNRYLSSLKKANNHHITPYAALIAMRVAELFMEIDENIKMAGLPSILSFLPDKPEHE